MTISKGRKKNPSEVETSSAEEFERKHGLTGISHRYRLPPGETEESLSNRAVAYCKKIIRFSNSFERTALHVESIVMDFWPPEKRDRFLQDNAVLIEKRRKGIAERTIPLKEMAEKLIELNPELKTISEQTSLDELDLARLSGIIHGVGCRFNPQDIAYFVLVHPHNRKENPKKISLERMLGHMGWVPSPATIDEIEKQVQQRPSISTSAVNYVNNRRQSASSTPLPPHN